MAIARTRTKDTGLEHPFCGTLSSPSSSVDLVYPYNNLRRELITTTDEIHQNHPYEGGPFSSRAVKVSAESSNIYVGRPFHTSKVYDPSTKTYSYVQVGSIYQGKVLVFPPSGVFPADQTSITAGYGPDCWNRFKPAKPSAQLTQMIGELRDVPQLLFRKLNSFRSIGNNYLAVEFGWKPFVLSIIDLFNAIKSVDEHIAQLQRDNGRMIRRHGTYKNSESTTFAKGKGAFYMYPTNYCVNPSWTLGTKSSERVWFSAAFKYSIPGLNGKWGYARSYLRTIGLELTPAEIWALLPFSWLVDWFSNVGSLISNLMSSLSDNLTARYAYVMRETIVVTTRQMAFNGQLYDYELGKYLLRAYAASTTTTVTTKTRVAASPFGFNVSFGGLSSWQTSILAALGLSSLRF